jgi:membrane associated rhomboid family serine protease
VEEPFAGDALLELKVFAEERARTVQPQAPTVLEPLRFGHLVLPALLMIGFFQVQDWFPGWTEAGLANSRAMLEKGEWWRAVTALTLHADLGHFLANISTILLFAVFLQAQLGAGVAWLLVVLSGALGNAVNAWGYGGSSHLSLGASTAVFGALGILVAVESGARWRSPAGRNRWQLILPLGAGLSFLAYLGVGEAHSRVDFMAHWWGLVSGLVLGAIFALASRGRRARTRLQIAAGVFTIGLLAACWLRAR